MLFLTLTDKSDILKYGGGIVFREQRGVAEVTIKRQIFTVLIAAVCVPLSLFVLFGVLSLNSWVLESHKSTLERFSSTESIAIMRELRDIRAQIYESAREADFKGEALPAVMNAGAYNGDLLIFDRSGTVLASGSADLLGRDIQTSELYMMTWNDDVSLSALTESEFRPGAQGVWAAYRIPGSDELRMAAFISADVIENRLADLRLDPTLTVLIISANPADTEVAGSGIESGSAYAYTVIPDLGCAIKIWRSTDVILAGNRDFARNALIAALLLALISIAAALTIAYYSLVKPIGIVRNALNRHGKYERCDLEAGGELGEIIEGFNGMTDWIRAARDDIREKEETLRHAEERIFRDRERMAASEERVRCATELSAIAIFELKLVTGEFTVSDSWQEITTYETRDVLPLEYVVSYIAHPDDRPALNEWITEGGRYDRDARFMTANNSDYKWLHLTMTPVEDAITGERKVIGTITDIQERVLAQERATYAAYHEALTGLPR